MFSSPPPLSAADDLAQGDPVQADPAGRQIALLERMAARCERVAEALERRLLRLAEREDETPEAEAATAGSINAASLAFDRANRAVRLALMLEAKIEAGVVADLGRRLADHEAAETARRASVGQRRDTLIKGLGLAIRAERRERPETERLFDRGVDWLYEQADADVLARPVGAVLEEALAYLGLVFDADLFESEDWAVEECLARPPGSPYAAPQAEWRPRHRAARAAAGPAGRPPDLHPP